MGQIEWMKADDHYFYVSNFHTGSNIGHRRRSKTCNILIGGPFIDEMIDLNGVLIYQ